MGGSLSAPQPALPPLAHRRPNPGPGPALAQHGVHGGGRVHAGPFPQTPPAWEPAKPRRVVSEAWSHLPAKPPPETTVRPDRPGAYVKLGHWRAGRPGQTRSPVTVRIAPPERRASPCASPGQGAHSAGHPRAEGCPDPCAKEAVLRALRQCRKGSRKLDAPLWFEVPESRSGTRDPAPRPSAFRPLFRNGEVPAFVPRPGPLSRSLCSRSSTCRAGTDPGPPAGTRPAQGWEPMPKPRWGHTQPRCGLGRAPGAPCAVGGASLAPEDTQPAALFSC